MMSLTCSNTFVREQAPRTTGSQPRSGSPADVERAQLESAQRVISLSKAAFILSISAIEFSAKHAVADHPNCLTVPQSRVYLRGIIQESARAGMISRHMEHGWSGILELRNMLVHNNAIAERTQAFEAGGARRLGNESFFSAPQLKRDPLGAGQSRAA